jgi:hypothetical protein
MSKGNTFENDLLLLIFNNTNAALIGDATGLRGSSVAGSLYVSFHTADPGEAGDQTTSEAAYTSYARVAVARTAGGWTVTNNSVSPAANIDAPASTGGSTTALTHFAIGTAASGAGKILYKGALSASIAMGVGVIPRLTTGMTVTED